MTAALTLQAHSLRESVRRYWVSFAKTALGDVIATTTAIGGIAGIFLACSYAVMWLIRVSAAVWQLLG